jgi:vitamin B12 transporter
VSSFGPTFFQYNRARFAGQSAFLSKGIAVTAGYEYEVENGFISYVGLHARRNNQAGFLDVRLQPIVRLTLSAGVRAEDNANFGTRVVPRAGAAYALRIAQGAFGDTRVHVSYGQGIVEPRFDQTFGTDPCFPGNPNLSPEQSRTVHAGVEQKLASDRVRLTADYFDSRFRNIISFQLDSITFCGTFFNTNLARARGANLSGEARVTRWLTANANYTYDSTRTLSAPSDPVNLDPNYLVGSRLLRRPVNSGNIMLNAAFRRMNWNLSGYFTGQRADYNYPGQIMNPGYARFDLAASYNVARGVSVYGRIANLADKKYQEAYGYPALGREFRIGVKYTTRHE